MAKLHLNFDLPGLMHSIKDGLHELERHSDDLRSCETPDDLERKLHEVGAEFEARLKDTFGSFVDRAGMGFDPSVATNGRDLGIKVKETAEGWTLTANVPGVSAKQCAVTVEDDGEHSRLRMYVPTDPRAGDDAQQQRRLIANYLKPSRLVDPGSVRASCIDGVLRVVVPKAPATERDIPVSDDKPGAGDAAAGEATMTLHVPGYAAADLSLALRLPARRLVLSGRNDRMGAFPPLDLALPRLPRGHGADVHVAAFCRDGVLTIRAAPAPAAAADAADASASCDVKVSATADPTGDDATVILEKPLPGVAAGDVSVHVDAESRCVKVTVDGPGAVGFTRRRRGKTMFFVCSLPRGVDAATVQASCADGLLRITAAAPAAVAERPVDVSADVPARLAGGGGDAAAGASE